MIAIVDYDAGNIRSVEKAFTVLGETPILTRDRKVILQADRVVLPGVGAFASAMEKLDKYGLISVMKEVTDRKIPFLGICLGLQLLFEESEESPGVRGLGILDGKIVKIPPGDGLKIPHMGWNSLRYPHKGMLFQGIDEGSFAYFVHSYYLQAKNPEIVVATSEYGVEIQAAVEKDNIFACQFHPEKSSRIGLTILKNFIHLKKKG